MPAPIIGAGISAAAGLVGGALQSRSQGKALDAQERANAEAMAFQREQASKAEEAYKQQWDTWNRSRQALLQRYGIDIAPPQMPGGGGAMPRAVAPVQGQAQGQAQTQAMPASGAMPRGGMTLNDLMQRGNLEGWNKWGNYGLR